MKISEYFTRGEFRCKCKHNCGFEVVDSELLTVLDDVREHFGKPTAITSGNRCKMHNTMIGGSSNSKHMLGLAADIIVKDVDAKEVYKYLDSKYPDSYGMGLYQNPGRVHIDVRYNKARWSY